MDRVAALVLAGGRGGDFGPLSNHRTKAAFPIGCYYRIIDFVLSNITHSGIRQAGIIIQFLPASLMEHIGAGRPWDFDMADRRLCIMTPFVGVQETRWFRGSGDAIAKNLNLIDNPAVQDVLILSGDHVYRMDYRELIRHHRETKADVTFACVRIPPEKQDPRFGDVVTGERGRVLSFVEKPEKPVSPLVSMGIYCFRREVLMDLLKPGGRPLPEGECSLAGDILAPNIARLNCQSWVFGRPWHYIGSLREYFDLHMALARGEVDLIGEGWDVMTNFSDRNLGSRPPAYFSASSTSVNSIVAPGCRIEGTVMNSVISPGVHVAPGAIVNHCAVFHDVKIMPHARLEDCIVDKDAVIGENAHVGAWDGDPARVRDRPVTVVPKAYRVPAGARIPCGAEIEAASRL
jgi:glucose-1-phosphate adenylyltransferase